MSALKARREALGLSVTQLARLCGCSESLIYYAENGRVIHPKFADRIAEKLKPKKYGNKVALTDADGGPLTVNVIQRAAHRPAE